MKAKKTGKLLRKIFGAAAGAAVVGLAVYIMANGLGLVDGLDFGAGAYYYADIPQFTKYVGGESYQSQTPMWALIALFLVWGYAMYRLWSWLEKKL